MSNQLPTDQNRRKFLKTAAYTSVLSAGGLSGLAFAKNQSAKEFFDNVLGSDADNADNNAIRIIQETLFDKESVTLINESGKLQMLDARQPISLRQKNGKLQVKVNQNDADAVNGMVLMSPNERFTFDVKTVGLDMSSASKVSADTALTNVAENQLQISSQHSVFNRIVPVQVV